MLQTIKRSKDSKTDEMIKQAEKLTKKMENIEQLAQ
jgi:hypothetical protein